ncbi:MAG: NAD(P)/FAD-dependent oxidoreductase [Saprospiraceae bacterium]
MIVGQGIAGTLLACSLLRRKAQVRIVDADVPGRSSFIAAGIINPVTGKRFVKSWRFDEFFPVAKKVYQNLEQEFGISIWEERPTVRLLHTPEELNDWSIRCAQAEYADYLDEAQDAGTWGPFLRPGFRFGVIQRSARVKFPLLLATFREINQKTGVFFEESIDYQNIETYLKNFDRVVFCEGWPAKSNPFFPETPFRISKGEALIIRFFPAQAVLPTEMLKKNLLVAPLGDGTFWAGSTFEWQFMDHLPSIEAREQVLGYLEEMFDCAFEIVDQVAGIRPTMLDRRPVSKQSDVNPRVFMFNGLGTKGALLAPFFAEQLANEICRS